MTSRMRINFWLVACKASPVKTKHCHLQILYLSILAVKLEKLTVENLSMQVIYQRIRQGQGGLVQ